MTQIFDLPVLHVKNVGWSAFTGRVDFDLLDSHERTIATVREPKPELWRTIFRATVGGDFHARHFLHADDLNGQPLFAVDKHNEFRGAAAGLLLPDIGPIGGVNKVNWNPIKPHLQIVDEQGGLAADLRVIPLGRVTDMWNFQVLDPQGTEIAEMLSSDPRTGLDTYGFPGSMKLKMKYRLPDRLRALVVSALVAVAWFKEEHYAD